MARNPRTVTIDTDLVTDPDPERSALISADLLPNPNGVLASAAYQAEELHTSAAVQEHERSIRNLARRVAELESELRRERTRRGSEFGRALSNAAALEWLRNSYDLDELALEVIDHRLSATHAAALIS